MGIALFPPGTRRTTRRKPPAAAPTVEGPVELVVLSVKQKAARCRLLGGEQTFTFRAGRLWELVPGELAIVKPTKQWTYAGNPYLSGAIESTRLDAKALGLVPLRLEERGLWNPAEHSWAFASEAVRSALKAVPQSGARCLHFMEVLPIPSWLRSLCHRIRRCRSFHS